MQRYEVSVDPAYSNECSPNAPLHSTPPQPDIYDDSAAKLTPHPERSVPRVRTLFRPLMLIYAAAQARRSASLTGDLTSTGLADLALRVYLRFYANQSPGRSTFHCCWLSYIGTRCFSSAPWLDAFWPNDSCTCKGRCSSPYPLFLGPTGRTFHCISTNHVKIYSKHVVEEMPGAADVPCPESLPSGPGNESPGDRPWWCSNVQLNLELELSLSCATWTCDRLCER